ncbi:hypothetical protein N9Z53_01505 [Mariniblastus sp.]|nr:hypothetical protein [Mariniblastus sp.]
MVEVNGNKIRFSCQFCAAKLNSNLKKAGTQDHCPECHRPFVTPGAEILKKRKEDKIKADAEQNRIAEAERLQKKEAETLRQAEVERLRSAARAKRNEQVSGIKEKAKSASKLVTSDNAQRIKSIKTRVNIVTGIFAFLFVVQYAIGLLNWLGEERIYAIGLFYGGSFCLLIWVIGFCTSSLIESLSIIEAGNMKRHHKAG